LIPACVHLLARIIVPIIPRYLERFLISSSTTVVQFTSPVLVIGIVKILAVPSWQYRLLLLLHLIEIAIAIAKVVIISTVALSVLTLSVTVVVIVATVTCVVVICERLLVRHLFYLNSLS